MTNDINGRNFIMYMRTDKYTVQYEIDNGTFAVILDGKKISKDEFATAAMAIDWAEENIL